MSEGMIPRVTEVQSHVLAALIRYSHDVLVESRGRRGYGAGQITCQARA